MSASQGFYRNVSLLTQAVSASKDFEKYFKEGMFDKPNSIGFIHVSHYLLMIYDQERFSKLIEWPIIDKRAEEKYRNNAKDFMTIVFNENEIPIECPKIQKSHLVAPHGRIIINIMHALSIIVLRKYLQKAGVNMLEAPKPGNTHPLTQLVFKTATAQHAKVVKELDQNYSKIENDAKEHAKETAEELETTRAELLDLTGVLLEKTTKATVHPDIRKRLTDCSDTEVIQLWMKHIENGTEYLRQRQLQLKSIEEQSTKVNNLVLSLFSEDKTILDGKKLPKINTAQLLELPLDPEAQVALHHLYIDDKLVLNNLLIVCISMIRYYRGHLMKHNFPDVSVCNEQIAVCKEDLQTMCTVIETMPTKISQVLNDLLNQFPIIQRRVNPPAFVLNDDGILDSVLFQASPKVTLDMLDYDVSQYDVQQKLKLTPVGDQHNILFARHKKPNDDWSYRQSRPKPLVSRINFDDTILSTNSNKFNTTPKRYTPTKSTKVNQSYIESRVGGKFSKLLASGSNKSSLNGTFVAPNLSKALSSTVIDSNNSEYNHNLSELRIKLSNTSSVSVNDELPMCNGYTSKNSLTNEGEKIGEDLKAINKSTVTELPQIPEDKPAEQKELKQSRRRSSIYDLVERYKKIRDPSIPRACNGN